MARTNGETRLLCCSVLVGSPFVVGLLALILWLNAPPDVPHFTVASLSISGGQHAVAFNVSDRNPNRHTGISYKGSARVSLLLDDRTVASGQAFADGWYQPKRNTTSIAGVLDVVVDEYSFNATLAAGRPLRLQLASAIRFRVGLNFFLLPYVDQHQSMYVECDVVVGAKGSLLRESVGAPCQTYLSAAG